MFSHIVPKTYLKTWKVPDKKESIFVFTKDTPTSKGIIRNLSKLSNTGFGKQNYYYLTIDKCMSKIYDFMFDDLLNKLNKSYYFIYKDKLIQDGAMFRLCYFNHKDEIEVIRKKDNFKTTINKIHNDINRIWDEEKKHFIEDFFSKNVENDWNKVVDEISTKTKNNTITTLNANYQQILILLIVLLLFRNHNYIKRFHPQFKTFDENELIDLSNDSITEFILLFTQRKYNKNNFISASYQKMIEANLCFEFLLSENCDFITSDNPTFFYDKSLYFPISPSICLKLYTYKHKKLIINPVKKEKTKEINKLCIQNCYNNIAFYCDNIADLI